MNKLLSNLFLYFICFCASSFMNIAIVRAEEVVDMSDCNKYIYQLGGMPGEESVLNPNDYFGIKTYSISTDYELAKAYLISELENGNTDINMSEYKVYQYDINNLLVEILNQNPQLLHTE